MARVPSACHLPATLATDDGSSKRKSEKKINRRSFLIGATTGAVATGAGAAGLVSLQTRARNLITLPAVESGKSAEIAKSF